MPDHGREYRRNLNYDEVQVQLRGTRLVVTDIGCVALGLWVWRKGVRHFEAVGN